MKTLNKLILSLVLLSTARGFAVDEVNNNSYFGFMKNKMSSFANYISNARVLRYVNNYFSNLYEDMIYSKNAKKYGFISATITGLSGVAYKYKDKLKTLASKLKNKSVSAKNYLLPKFSTLKSKIQGIDNKKKKGLYVGALALASGAAYLAYKKYKNQNKKLERETKLESAEEKLFQIMIIEAINSDDYSSLIDDRLTLDESFKAKLINNIDIFISNNFGILSIDELVKLQNIKNNLSVK